MGAGTFCGMQLDFNSNNVWVKLTIDNNEVFELKMTDINSIQPSGKNMDSKICNMMRVHGGNKFEYAPKNTLVYTDSIKIEAKKLVVVIRH